MPVHCLRSYPLMAATAATPHGVVPSPEDAGNLHVYLLPLLNYCGCLMIHDFYQSALRGSRAKQQ